MSIEFDEKLKRLRTYYEDPDSLDKLASKERTLRALVQSTSLKDNEIIQGLIVETRKTIEGIDMLLKEDNEMPEDTRKRLFTERKIHLFHLARLGGAEAARIIESIERDVDKLIAEVFPEG